MPYPVQWQRELDALKAPVTIRWQDASGQDEFIFTGSPDNQRSGIIMLAGATGLGIAPTDQVVTDYPALDGGFLQGGRFASREIMLPLYVWGRTRQEFLRLMNALAATMRPDVPRRLVVEDRTFPRLRTRYAECYYSSGWEGDESYDASGRTWAKLGITLAAPDPWFHEPTAETFTVSSSKPTVTVPELLGGSAWPTIRVSMPYGSSNMRITNVTSGQQIRIDLWAMAWELIDGDMSTVVD
uniref:phage tail domain-containing protein n=1 Tax=Actinomadura oligospora TaxID=111804 RepID=UPI00047A05C7